MTRRHLALFFIALGPACSDLTAPASHSKESPREAQRPAADPAALASAAAQLARAAQRPPDPHANPGHGEPGHVHGQAEEAAPDMARASHILVAYQGASRANPQVTRSKEEARKRAEELAARARKGEDFGKLAVENSDDPTAAMRSGDLGRFTRERMVKPFSDATFGMKPGDISGIVETPFGFHVIKRTE
jgi:peptidyl-prolyl cis-trans isomerase NIMA-interacting 1